VCRSRYKHGRRRGQISHLDQTTPRFKLVFSHQAIGDHREKTSEV
jgi:hypothetical protein